MIRAVLIVIFVGVVKRHYTKKLKQQQIKRVMCSKSGRKQEQLEMGRGTTPDGNGIFNNTNMNAKEDVDTIDTGFGSRKPTPEERIEALEKEVEELKRYHKLNSMDEYLKGKMYLQMTGTDIEDSPIFLFHIGWSREREVSPEHSIASHKQVLN